MPRGADLAGQRHAAGCRVRARVASAGPSAHASLTHMEHVRALIGLVDADVPEDLLRIADRKVVNSTNMHPLWEQISTFLQPPEAQNWDACREAGRGNRGSTMAYSTRMAAALSGATSRVLPRRDS